MKKKLLKRIYDQRFTILFIVLASLLWFSNRLNRRFTSEIPIDIEIVEDFNSNVWLENHKLTYQVNCEADGRLLMLAKIGLLPTIKVNSSTLRYIPRDTYVSTIDPNSLKHAIQQKLTDVTINYITDSLNPITISPLAEKVLPIKSDIVVSCKRQHMIVGGIMLYSDSITVKAPQIILDTMNFVRLEHYEKHEVGSSFQSVVDLVLPENVLAQQTSVGFRVEVAPFTEVDVNLPIEVRNLTANSTATIVPSQTNLKVRVPLDKYTDDINVHAVVDLNKKRKSNLYEVLIDSLPYGAKIIMIDPQFVEPFIQN